MKYAPQILTSILAAAVVALPIAASAAVPGESQLHGRITAFNGRYDVHVQTRSGEIDDVTLHQGTIINPTGLTLRPGMRVTILGNRDGGSFDANEIDTPYHVALAPIPAYGPLAYEPGYFDPGFARFGFDNPLYTGGFYGVAPYEPVYVVGDRDGDRSGHPGAK